MSKILEMDRVVLLSGIIFFLVGICFFVGGLVMSVDESNSKDKFDQTEGVITNIIRYRKPNEDSDSYDVMVEYTIGDVEYEGITDDWSNRMYVGEIITVFYNPDDHGDFRLHASLEILAHMFTLAGFCSILMATIFFKAGISAENGVSSSLICSTVFLVLGIMSIGGGLEWRMNNKDFKKTAIQEESVITAIEQYEYYDYPTVKVAFTVDGVEYQGGIGKWDSDMYVGQPITIFYNPENPRDFRTDSSLLENALILAGLVFLLIVASPYIMSLLKYIAFSRFEGNNRSYNREDRVFTKKDKVLRDAIIALNKREQPWEVMVKGNTIEAHWKWKTLSSAGPVLRTRENLFIFSVTLNDTGRWWENLDVIQTTPNSPSFRESFSGKTYQKSIVFSIERDKQTRKLKLKKDQKMDTATIKRAVRQYLTACGWEKAKLFGRLN